MGREGRPHPVHHFLGLVQPSRQKQVPDDHPPLQDALLVQDVGARLTDHLLDGSPGDLGIVRRPRPALGIPGIGIFIVRQIDVNGSLQRPEGLHPVIAPAVPNHGDGQRLGEGLRHHVSIVGGIDQINVMGPGVNQRPKDLPQPFHRDLPAKVPLADGLILAKDAPQGASGKKHRARAPGPGEGRFLPEVQRRPGHEHLARSSANPALPRRPIGPAPPGA